MSFAPIQIPNSSSPQTRWAGEARSLRSREGLDLAAWDDYVGQGHLNPGQERICPRPDARIQRQEFLGHGDPAGVGKLGFGRRLSGQRRRTGDGLARRGPRRRRGQLLAVAQRFEWPGGNRGTLVGADGTPVRLYPEAQQIGRSLPRRVRRWPGLRSNPKSRCCILTTAAGPSIGSGTTRTTIRPRNWRAIPDRCAQRVSPSTWSTVAPLSQYKLVVAPGLNVLSDAAAKNLIAYVRGGGHLVLGQRSAMKDEDNGLQPERQPGPLADLLGGRVEQYYALVDPVGIMESSAPGKASSGLGS